MKIYDNVWKIDRRHLEQGPHIYDILGGLLLDCLLVFMNSFNKPIWNLWYIYKLFWKKFERYARIINIFFRYGNIYFIFFRWKCICIVYTEKVREMSWAKAINFYQNIVVRQLHHVSFLFACPPEYHICFLVNQANEKCMT